MLHIGKREKNFQFHEVRKMRLKSAELMGIPRIYQALLKSMRGCEILALSPDSDMP
jgi:hypothetical protein